MEDEGENEKQRLTCHKSERLVGRAGRSVERAPSFGPVCNARRPFARRAEPRTFSRERNETKRRAAEAHRGNGDFGENSRVSCFHPRSAES